MRRIGLISDLHGNLPALEAVLAELEAEGVEELVCFGDVAVGPSPGETIARVRELGCPVILGNWDEWFAQGIPPPANEVQSMLADIGNAWASRLTASDRRFLESLLPTLELELDGGATMLCFHGSPRSDEDQVFASTPEAELEAMFDGRRASLLVGGHTHVQLYRRASVGLIVNPGSVGMPFLDWWPQPVRVAPWAEYAVLEQDDGRLRLDFRRTPYEVDALFDLCRESGMPHCDWWIGCWAADPADC